MAKIGQFVWAKIAFAEGDGRYKVRPVLILDRQKLKDGSMVYLAAAKYSAYHKQRGAVEVVMSAEDALAVGMDAEGVLRFSREDLVAFMDKDITSELSHYTKLAAIRAEGIRRAAKSVRFTI